ncbi:MAG: hypothetical protein ABIP58_06570 [Dehalococcoidia bacterium]
MLRLPILVGLIILTVACTSTVTEPGDPFLRGVITSRASSLHGVQDGTGVRIDSVPAMFVDGVGIWPAAEPCAAQARFFIGGDTEVYSGNVRADTGQLRIGRRVTVWATGVVLQSCPPQTGATRVLLED